MNENAPTKPESYEQALISGNLANLTPEQRLSYYKAVCESVGLNPLTKPFEYITLNKKLVLYPTRNTAEQLRKLNHVSIAIVDAKFTDEAFTHYSVRAKATDRSGRNDESIAVIYMRYPKKYYDKNGNKKDHPYADQIFKGDDYANAIMKCETKAKRRVTLSICGLGMLDESEVETIAADEQGSGAQAADQGSALDKFEKGASIDGNRQLAAPVEQPMAPVATPMAQPEPVTVAAPAPAATVAAPIDLEVPPILRRTPGDRDAPAAPMTVATPPATPQADALAQLREGHEPDYVVDPETGEVIPIDESEPSEEELQGDDTPDNSDNTGVVEGTATVETATPLLPPLPTNIKEQLANNRWLAWLDWFIATIQPMDAKTAAALANAYDNEIMTVMKYQGKHARRLKETLQQKGVV